MTFAFFFDSVGGGEWLVLLAVILVVVGPRNLPSAARKIGQIMSQLRRAADEFKRQLMAMDEEVHKAVDEVKQDYMDVGQDVQDTVSDDGTSVDPSDGAYNPDDPYAGIPSDASPEDSDRAMWESYGREYDPYGGFGSSDDGGSSVAGDSLDAAPSADEVSSEVVSSEQASDSSAEKSVVSPASSSGAVS